MGGRRRRRAGGVNDVGRAASTCPHPEVPGEAGPRRTAAHALALRDARLRKGHNGLYARLRRALGGLLRVRAMANQKSHWLTRLSILAPYAWLTVFFLVPFLIVLKISLSQTAIALPPYEPLLDLSAGWEGLKAFLGGLSLDSYASVFTDSLYVWSYWKSIQIAAISTLILLAVGYPVASALAPAPRRLQGVLVLAVIVPFWTGSE